VSHIRLREFRRFRSVPHRQIFDHLAMQGLFQLFEKLIVLLNLEKIDLIHSPTDSLVSAKQPGAETLPPNGPRKVRLIHLVPSRTDRPIVLSYLWCCSAGNK